MLKKLFLLAASCVLLYSCIGCSGNQSRIGNANQVSSENKTVGEDEIPTVVWQIYDESQGLGGRFTDIWQASLDRLLVEKGAPYKVKIEVYYESIEDAERFSPAQLLENIKSENQQADVIAIPSTMIGWDENGNLLYDYYSYQEMIRQELLEPLDDILKTEKGAKIREALTRMELKRSQVNGVTYGISQHMRIFNAVAYRKDLLEKYGIKQEELSDDIFENDDILKVVRDGEEEKVVPYVTDMGDLRRLGIWIIDECEMLACNQEGTFVNVFESDELKKYLNQKKGLLEQRLTNIHNQSSGDFFAIASYAGTDQIYETVYKVYDPGKGEQELDVVVIPNKKSPQLALYGGDSATGIATWSKHKKEAFDFLTLLYTDVDIANLIQYGVEGIDYSIQDGYAVYKQDNTLSTYGKYFTNPLLTYPEVGMPQNRRAMLEQCYEDNEAHLPNGFRFNPQPVLVEINAVTEILGSYGEYTDEVKHLINGDSDNLNAALESFNEKLRAVGSDKIVEEANRQLAEWREKYD